MVGGNPDGLYLHVKDTIDVLLRGRQAAVPPTRHPKTGEPYRWRSARLWDAPLNQLPVLTYDKIEALHERLGGKSSKRERDRRATMAGKPAPVQCLMTLCRRSCARSLRVGAATQTR
jgi:hypothetical protein